MQSLAQASFTIFQSELAVNEQINPPEGQEVLKCLLATIEQRYRDRPDGSYTTRLFEAGAEKINEKLLEEAAEVAEAALEPGQEGREHLIYEIADLLYHLLVLMGNRQIKLEEVDNELARRFGLSGLDEKAARSPNSDA